MEYILRWDDTGQFKGRLVTTPDEWLSGAEVCSGPEVRRAWGCSPGGVPLAAAARSPPSLALNECLSRPERFGTNTFTTAPDDTTALNAFGTTRPASSRHSKAVACGEAAVALA